MNKYRILSAKCGLCGKEACGEWGTIVAAGWKLELAKAGNFVAYGAPGNRCPACAKKEMK